MRGNECSIHVADGVLGKQCHICAFFNGFDEQHRVLRSFIKEGFERGDKAFHIVDPELREDHLKRLAEAGIDVEQAIETGQLELRRWQDAYLRDDRFDQTLRGLAGSRVGDLREALTALDLCAELRQALAEVLR